ncbi:MAG TPA: YggS family pyridoxal phosphate-dependent enzyme [Microbacteriaceae bacterium]|jgi:pyridoxal phosphate enzyme, YggS family
MPEPALSDRLSALRSGIADAAREAARDPSDIRLIVVTKFHPASLVRQLHTLGVHDFGESRHQEARAKAAELADLDLTWHFVGQLQSKKARQVRGYADVLHSVDRIGLVEALESSERPVDCFLQVNLTDDPSRGGVQPGELEPLAERMIAADGIRLLGVMAVAPLGAPPRQSFAALRVASEAVTAIEPAARFISAGMSADYREAILEGATHLRIGTAITGIRPQAG